MKMKFQFFFKLVAFLQKSWFGLGSVGTNTIISPFAKFKGNKKGINLGNGVVIDSHVFLECTGANGVIFIGNGSKLHRGSMVITGENGSVRTGVFFSLNPYSVIYGHGGLILGDYVRLATQVVIIPANHIFSDAKVPITKQGLTKKGIKIGNDVWLGAGVRVLDGVVIGDGVVVGAGAVVTKSLPPYTIATGVPAKFQRIRL